MSAMRRRKRNGATPLIDVTPPGVQGTILAKVEGTNPGASIKDRVARSLLEEARRSNPRASSVVEASSGNTAVSIAMLAGEYGFDTYLFIPSGSANKIERAKSYGATVIETPENLGTAGAQTLAGAIWRSINGSVYLSQHSSPANVSAHYTTTGPEILRQAGQIGLLVAGIGTGGTIMGTSKFLSDMNALGRTTGVIPDDGTSIPGLRKLDPEKVPLHRGIKTDNLVKVDPDRAEWWRRRIETVNGISTGPSSGAAMAAAVEEMMHPPGGIAVVVFPDHGSNYDL